MAAISDCRYRWLASSRFETHDFLRLHDRKFRRAQLSIRHGNRKYDRSVAGLGTGKAQRYFASDLIGFPVACSTLRDQR
jgi:hypothetical protein